MSPEQVLSNVVSEIFSPLYKLVVAIAALYFLYGVARYVYDLNNPEEQTYGKSHLLWGTVGLFIILSVGGILAVMGDVFDGMFK